MLTAEQVKAHSQILIGRDIFDEQENDCYYNRIKARFLYIHNERASSLRIVCELPRSISGSQIELISEEEIKSSIDWERFTDWINAHDDLTEDNLTANGEWVRYDIQQTKLGKIGRNGLLDIVNNKVVDRNKMALL